VTPEPWHWLLLGGALIVIEALAPGFVALWLGIAALLTGGAAWLVPSLGWQAQILLFAVLAAAAVGGWFAWRPHHPQRTDQPSLNRRGDALVGERLLLVEPILHGRGRARAADTSWAVSGPDLPAGSVVRVTAAQGSVLVVEPVGDPAPLDPAGSPV
jgi:membrane protein implicated in regulation of membrane protease activity